MNSRARVLMVVITFFAGSAHATNCSDGYFFNWLSARWLLGGERVRTCDIQVVPGSFASISVQAAITEKLETHLKEMGYRIVGPSSRTPLRVNVQLELLPSAEMGEYRGRMTVASLDLYYVRRDRVERHFFGFANAHHPLDLGEGLDMSDESHVAADLKHFLQDIKRVIPSCECLKSETVPRPER